MGHVDGEYLANFRNIIGGFTRLDIASRKDAEALSLVVKSFETQMSPMTTDTHGYHDLCSSFFIGAICVLNELTAHIMPCERIMLASFNIQHSLFRRVAAA